jgi:3-oxoacyl-[acyl-carrier protein] reductase
MNSEEKKRIVVVSGGGTGIGREIARTFARSGDIVLILGRRVSVVQDTANEINSELKNNSSPGKIEPISCDLEDANSVSEITNKIHSSHGSVNIIVNNAGGVDRQFVSSLEEIRNSWLKEFSSNVLSAVLLTTSLLPHFKRPGGRIINMSSIAALRGGGSYGAAKAAIIGWTFDLAKSLGKEGITVNAVAPGYIAGTEFFRSAMTPERHQRLVNETLDGRPGTPSDVAATVHFLASDEASHITGQIIQVNGGALFGR